MSQWAGQEEESASVQRAGEARDQARAVDQILRCVRWVDHGHAFQRGVAHGTPLRAGRVDDSLTVPGMVVAMVQQGLTGTGGGWQRNVASRGGNAGLFGRVALLGTAVFGVSVALGASTAAAGTVSYDGDAVVFTGGDALDHELQFRLDGNNDDIIDSPVSYTHLTLPTICSV